MGLLLLFASASIGVVAYSFYFNDTRGSEISPNRWSWLIWSITTLVEALTYREISGDPMEYAVFLVSAACCSVVTTLIWTKSKWQIPDWTEVVSLVVSIAAVVVWIGFCETVWAHYLTVGALPVAFWPTWRDSWKNYDLENSRAWGLWSIGDFVVIILVLTRIKDTAELPLAITEFACHVITWGIVTHKRRKALSL
ncbi:hypothetical protein KW800_03235 [Candidatus Parcubacteria bacterium]|nr:hypothetical protein [Candidatus Parcubacteria bacterium]